MISKSTPSQYQRYLKFLNDEYHIAFSSYEDCHLWSVSKQDEFWKSIALYFSVQFDTPYLTVRQRTNHLWQTRWFEGASLSYAKNIFAQFSNSRPAIVYQNETTSLAEISWQCLLNKTVQIQKELLDKGVQKGDCVVAYCVNSPETIAAFLATNALGAIWSSCSPDFGLDAVRDRFTQLQPKVLFGHSMYSYNGRAYDVSVNNTSLCDELDGCLFIDLNACQDFDDPDASLDDLFFQSVDFSHPIWVLFSSGTTGKPKAIVHGTGSMILEHVKALGIHQNVSVGDRYFWYSTTGWMMWNYSLSSLLCGATLCIYYGAPHFPDTSSLWRFAAQATINHFGHGAVYYQQQVDAGFAGTSDLTFGYLKTIGSTGSPLSASTCIGLQKYFTNAHVISLSGGTDVCTAFLGGHPETQSIPGEIQCKMLGAPVAVWNDKGEKILDQAGELVLTDSFLAMPIFLWGDSNFSQLRKSYYSMFSSFWNHGDWATEKNVGSFVIHGRSDATLNRYGVRIGTAEIYNALHIIDEIEDSLIIHLTNEHHEKLLLFVQSNDTLDFSLIKSHIRNQCSPRHIPDEMIRVPAIPYTISGKKVEVPIKRLLMGMSQEKTLSRDAMRNPSAIDWFIDYAKTNSFT